MDRRRRHLRRRMVISGALGSLLLAGGARAQTGGPIRILVGFAPGGGNDVVARIVAQKIGEATSQSLIVENRTGASGLIAADVLAKAPPDGRTLMVASQATYSVAQLLYRNVSFRGDRDCAGVALLGASPLVLLVHPSVKANSLAELIALAKAQPGGLNMGSGGAGTTLHLAGELLMLMAGIKLVHIPYRGEAPAVADLLAGQVPIVFSNIASCVAHVKSGAARALGVTSLTRSPIAPELPTLAESGLPGFDVETWYGLTAPPGTPREVLLRLNALSLTALADADLRRRFADLGLSVGGGPPERLDTLIRDEIAKWAKVIRDAGIEKMD